MKHDILSDPERSYMTSSAMQLLMVLAQLEPDLTGQTADLAQTVISVAVLAASDAGGFHGFGGSDGHTFHFEGGEGDDIFGDIFGNMFGGGKKSRFTGGFHQDGSGFNGFHGYSGFGADPSSEKGSDAQAEINISFDDAAFGADRVITLSDANGKSQNLKVHIPAGINEGQSIRLKGKGNPGIGGAEAGDLLLKVHVGTRPGYERKGMDVYTSTEVAFTTAVLGGEIIVPTLYGNVSCKIKEGTRCGSKIRLAGRGIVSMKDPEDQRRPVCDYPDRCSAEPDSRGKRKTERIYGCL